MASPEANLEVNVSSGMGAATKALVLCSLEAVQDHPLQPHLFIYDSQICNVPTGFGKVHRHHLIDSIY